jgi:oligosaccharide reducing-end xylanase
MSAVLACGSGAGDPPASVGGGGGSSVGSTGGAEPNGGAGTGSGGTGGAAAIGGMGGAGAAPIGGMGGRGATGGAAGAAVAGTMNNGGSGVVEVKPRTACTAPAGYRNLFSEVLGVAPVDVQTKMTGTVQQLFHGSGEDQPVYFELSANSSQAYVQDIANDDVRSEGQSYGMFIAVEMNMQAEFDKLWNYAKSCMQQPNGIFAWQMNVDSCTPKSTGQAPDGDEYFAEALLLAHRRWGDGAINYGAEALKVMAAVAAQDFKSNPAIVKFSAGSNFSDPSYVLPLFYSEWACFDTANATLWQNAASYARTFFPKVINQSTGLAPYQANFDGSAFSAGNTFNADSWRVPMNVMADYAVNGMGTWQTGYAATNAAFWTSQGISTYGDQFTLTGTPMDTYHGAGLTGVNAMLAFGLSATDATPFLEEAWYRATPTGQYRYYDGMLYALSMLYLTGTFSLYY